MQQLASAIGVAAVSSIFFQAVTSGFAQAIKTALIAVIVLTVLSLPFVALMPRKATGEAPMAE